MIMETSKRTIPALCLLLFCLCSTKFASHAFPVAIRSIVTPRSAGLPLCSTSNPMENDEGSDSSSTSNADEVRVQKKDLVSTLAELESLQNTVMEAADMENLETLQSSLQDLERNVTTQISMLVPPTGLSAAEYAATMRAYAKLPVRSRIAFCKALQVNNPIETALDFEQIPSIAAMLYTERQQFTPAKLKASMKSTELLVFQKRRDGISTTPTTDKTVEESLSTPSIFNQQGGGPKSSSSPSPSQISTEDDQFKSLIEQSFSRVTRQNGREATLRDLQTLQDALKDRESFAVSKTQRIPGGFLLFGTPNSKLAEQPEALLRAIDQKLPRQSPCQVSYIQDFTATSRGEEESLNAPTLVLLHKDMAPEARPILRILSNLVAIATAFLFSVGVYGGNNLVMDRLEEKTPTGDFVGFEWFTEKTLAVLLPILVIQLLHELGHLIVQKRYDLKTNFPTLLPGWGLPVLGCQTNLVESPPSQKALFDFAFCGPLLGLLAAMGFFVTGLELTNAADSETIKYLPALPVDVLRSSTLGGSLVDYFLGGGQGLGQGFITLQDPKIAVPLHPYAIAGFTGLLANALALIPLGSTDGGRMSMSIFGRPGQLLISGGVWLFLLIASFSFERADALIGAWVVYNIVQNDLEIPCRDEVTEVDAVRAVSAFLLWFVAILAVVPM